jgi:nitrogenase molybdenum-iron protein NifN
MNESMNKIGGETGMKNALTANTAATRNACKLCTPLGAALAFKGIRGAVPLLHGSQGCSTYIRRYLISHFREPVDIACSNFSEQTAVFGGAANLELAIENICSQYAPEIIAVATTCLSETIGDDVPRFLADCRRRNPDLPPMVHVSSPSYRGTHMEGFHDALRAVTAALCKPNPAGENVSADSGRSPGGMSAGPVCCNLMPGMVSPADIRHLKQIMSDCGIRAAVLPDYSETLDGPMWSMYHKIPPGGISVDSITAMAGASAGIELGRILAGQKSAAKDLEETCKVKCLSLGLPMGIQETDRLFEALADITGRPMPEKYEKQRGRLIDAYADGHKYVSGMRAVIYGEQDFVCGMAAFAAEIGMIPVLCASGAKTGRMEKAIAAVVDPEVFGKIRIMEGADFVDIEEAAAGLDPQIFLGSSKGHSISRKLGVPLVRAGFPVHDRFGAPRLLHLGYRGAAHMFDRIVNAVIRARQTGSPVGYAYM